MNSKGFIQIKEEAWEAFSFFDIKDVAIIGGGYVGLKLLKRLDRGKNVHFWITHDDVTDREPFGGSTVTAFLDFETLWLFNDGLLTLIQRWSVSI